jgi:hypothetical protein
MIRFERLKSSMTILICRSENLNQGRRKRPDSILLSWHMLNNGVPERMSFNLTASDYPQTFSLLSLLQVSLFPLLDGP